MDGLSQRERNARARQQRLEEFRPSGPAMEGCCGKCRNWLPKADMKFINTKSYHKNEEVEDDRKRLRLCHGCYQEVVSFLGNMSWNPNEDQRPIQ